MKQAKTLNEKEIKSIFAQIATRRHSVRDRAIFAISFYAGLRAHEIASLNIDNIVNADGSIVTSQAVTSSTVAVPEPSSISLLILGASGLIALRRFRKNS